MTQADWDFYQEYANAMNEPIVRKFTPEELRKNLEIEQAKRREKIADRGKYASCNPLQGYESKLAAIAEANCKSKKEWQDMEAEDMRSLTRGSMVHKSPDELVERYKDKIQRVYWTDDWYKKQIEDSELKILELEKLIIKLLNTNRKRALKGAQNKLRHWRERLTGLRCNLMQQWGKERRLEEKNMKWMGIMEKINILGVARQIQDERRGIGNKYGFNPLAESRETAEIMFED